MCCFYIVIPGSDMSEDENIAGFALQQLQLTWKNVDIDTIDTERETMNLF